MANRIMLNQTSYHGAGAINELPTEVKSRGLKKALICCGPTLLRHGVIARVTDVMDAAGLSYEIYSDIKPNPTIENVTDGVAALRRPDPVRKAQYKLLATALLRLRQTAV